MYEINQKEAFVFLVCWALSFLACAARLLYSGDIVEPRRVLGLCSLSGFLTFALCAIWANGLGDQWTNPWGLFGFSAFFGTLGKDQDAFAKKYIFERFTGKRDAEKDQ